MRPSAPLHMTVNIVGTCDLDCTYCYAQPFNLKTMPFEDVISVLSEAKRLGVFVLKLAGGEPMLHPKIIDILQWCGENDLGVALLSNFTSKPKIVRAVFDVTRKYPNICLQASLDSVNENINNITRGKTREVLSNIEIAIEEGIDLQIATVLTSSNIESAHEIVENFFPRLRRFHFMNLMPTVKIRRNGTYDQLKPAEAAVEKFWMKIRNAQERNPDKILVTEITDRGSCNQSCRYSGCSAGFTFCEVDSNGDVIACNIASSFKLGNIYEASLQEIWLSDRSKKVGDIPVSLCHTYLDENSPYVEFESASRM
jgi:MoaA/NifB/PqqE/SkfB family radical SAM enzyme